MVLPVLSNSRSGAGWRQKPLWLQVVAGGRAADAGGTLSKCTRTRAAWHNSRDPDDDHVLAASLAVQAGPIVTGEGDLLTILGTHGLIDFSPLGSPSNPPVANLVENRGI
jgi:hypothetical protein